MVSYVAVPWQLYQLTHSNAQVGLLGLVQLLPVVVCGLLGGAVADRGGRPADVGSAVLTSGARAAIRFLAGQSRTDAGRIRLVSYKNGNGLGAFDTEAEAAAEGRTLAAASSTRLAGAACGGRASGRPSSSLARLPSRSGVPTTAARVLCWMVS